MSDEVSALRGESQMLTRQLDWEYHTCSVFGGSAIGELASCAGRYLGSESACRACAHGHRMHELEMARYTVDLRLRLAEHNGHP